MVNNKFADYSQRHLGDAVADLRREFGQDVTSGRMNEARIDLGLIQEAQTLQNRLLALTNGGTATQNNMVILPFPFNPEMVPMIDNFPVNTPYIDPIAAGETASATGDSQIRGGDGGHFNFQGDAGKVYNLLNDTGLIVNTRFQAWRGNNNATTVGQAGILCRGVGGYSRVQIDPYAPSPVTINGRLLPFGYSTMLADGGILNLSGDGRSVKLTTGEGYDLTFNVRTNGSYRFLDTFVKTPSYGVASDRRIPGGILGQTFDADSLPENGVYTNYEIQNKGISDPIFGLPNPQTMKSLSSFTSGPVEPIYSHYFGFHPDTHYRDLSSTILEKVWADTLKNNAETSSQDSRRTEAEQTRKMELLLMAALKSGNIDMAVLLLASVESYSANKVASNIMQRISKLQDQRKEISNQMANLEGNTDQVNNQVNDQGNNQANDQGSAGKLYALNTQATNIGTEVSLLQTFLQDAIASKRNALEFASNYLKSTHDTARAIIQNIGR